MGHIAKTDAELVEASRRGEREAFGLLVTRYQDVVCAVSFSSTGNWALSEDVAQDTFIAAWHQLGQLRETGRLRSWLCGIARNLARKARRRTDREAAVDEDVPALDANPFDATAQAEVDRVVREALARIPDTYRETLVLYYCENRSIREVAAVLGVSEDAAMQRLTRGRRYLATGVNELVERSLTGGTRKVRKGLVAAVMAALPVTGVPGLGVSRVDASPIKEGSTMLKIGIAAAVFVAVGTTAIVAQRSGGSSSEAKASTSAAPAAAKTAAVEPLPVPPAPKANGPVLPKAPGVVPAMIEDDDASRLIGADTIAKLKLDKGPSRGPANAPVTIIVFQDLLCKYCGTVLATIDEIWDEYPGKLRLVVKQLPVHREARLAAEASLAADAQGKFWELHDVMMANQDDLTRDAIIGYGKQAGMDVGKLTKALDQHTYQSELEAEVAAATEIGVNAVPTFLINGEEVQGARPAESFRTAIESALAAAK
ncbi:MAG TPA: sigma-70 family RNA polymerase sigma factor [Kofleriaceae bacterium]